MRNKTPTAIGALLGAVLMVTCLPSSHAQLTNELVSGSSARAVQAQELLASERFQEASDYCAPWLSELVREYSDNAVELVPALNCIGSAQIALGNALEAATAFERSVVILEREKGVFDSELSKPLEALGASLQQLSQWDEAADALQKAKGITHRNSGVFNTEQAGIVDRLTTVYLLASESRKAEREQRFLLQAHVQKYGESPQLLGALRRNAQWQMDNGRAPSARVLYRRALAIMERAYGADDVRLVGPLRDYARSFTDVSRNARFMNRSGLQALTRVVDIYQAQEFVDQADVTEALADVGDWFVIAGKRRKALAAYSQAWESAGDRAAETFAQPISVEFQDQPIQIERRLMNAAPDGVLELEFEYDVDANGRVKGVTVVRDEIQSRKFALRVAELIKRSRYRPRMVEGRPVATSGLRKTLRYDFSVSAVPSNEVILSSEPASVDADGEPAKAAVDEPAVEN